MDPISKTDRLIALLRQRLQERSRAAQAGRRGKASQQKSAAPLSGLAALPALQGLDQAQLRRTCIQALLADQFGPELLNEPQFQQIVSRVTDALAADDRSAALLDRVVSELQAGR
jgi:hypothetical protein